MSKQKAENWYVGMLQCFVGKSHNLSVAKTQENQKDFWHTSNNSMLLIPVLMSHIFKEAGSLLLGTIFE
jgi:hypothetical protein